MAKGKKEGALPNAKKEFCISGAPLFEKWICRIPMLLGVEFEHCSSQTTHSLHK
jgi:hypothetical protein